MNISILENRTAGTQPVNIDQQRGLRFLDRAEARIRSGEVNDGMRELVMDLNDLRLAVTPETWTSFCRDVVPEHNLRGLLNRSPITHRCFSKPRGYAGDAETLDWIYGEIGLPVETSTMIREIFDFEFAASVCQSVRERRTILTNKLNEAADRASAPRVMSVSCGHLREAHDCEALKSRKFADFYAIDQDAESLSMVEKEFGHFGVTPIKRSIRNLLFGKKVAENLDLIYVAGLYDYLPDAAAQSLTSLLLEMLKSGGRVLIANFAHNLIDIGYLEAFMNWKIIYRDENEFKKSIGVTEQNEAAICETFREPGGNLVFIELTKR